MPDTGPVPRARPPQPAPPPSDVVTVVGVDGRRGGWALAVVAADAGSVHALEWHTIAGQDAAGFRAVLALARSRDAVTVGVDCPIGLPGSGGWRPCDLLAKRRLGRAAARVFLAPPRPVLAAADYAAARSQARLLLGGRGVSAQAYGIRRPVLAVDEVLTADAEAAARTTDDVVEVHPELSFMALTGRADGDPLPSKRTPEGRRVRVAALHGWLRAGVPLDPPNGDDHLDALAVAWSARRWAEGTATVLDGTPDPHGLPMRIVI